MNKQPIHAQLIGATSCAALGVTISSSSPVLALCRKLVADGYDPATPLEVYRGETLCLKVRSIGEGARLEVNAYGTGFRAHGAAKAGPAPPVHQNQEAAAEPHPLWQHEITP
jgi:hypothetical protein